VLLCVAPGEATFTLVKTYPVEVGVKVTLIVQKDPAGTDVPQLLVCENRLGVPPVSVMLVMGSVALPVFVTVMGLAALVVPTVTLPKETDVGDTVKGSEPVPVRVADCVTVCAVTFSVAFMPPAAFGVNTTFMVQVPPEGMELAQVFVCENWLAPVPVKLMLGGGSVPPLLVTVTACAVLVDPTWTEPNARAVGEREKLTGGALALIGKVLAIEGTPAVLNANSM
jgi:hypothetical protein